MIIQKELIWITNWTQMPDETKLYIVFHLQVFYAVYLLIFAYASRSISINLLNII